MKDAECIAFLRWCLPRLDMRWAGFRKARRQVCKRIGRRLGALRLDDVAAYRAYLDTHPEEWPVLDGLCRVTISRFFRDRGVFDALGGRILPTLTALAAGRGDNRVRCWSVGCASGEEPYSLAILWQRRVRPRLQGPPISILGTDADAAVLRRAAAGCYAPGTLKELPEEELTACFELRNRQYCLRDAIRDPIRFREQDVRTDMPDGLFHLILCRNLVFTYFSETRQKEILRRLVARLVPGGCLVIGRHERLPPGAEGLNAETGRNDMFWKRRALESGPVGQRKELIEEIDREMREMASLTGRAALAPRVREALLDVPREAFVAPGDQALAYINRPLPIGHGQTISQPLVVAVMTELLDPGPEHRVLEIGTGSGYQAAVLARIVGRVYSVEVIESLAVAARARLARLGYDNVEVLAGDGAKGWPEHAPYDSVIVTAAAPELPPALIAQLKRGGRMVIPLGTPFGSQELTLVEKDAEGKISEHFVFPVAFVPFTGAG